MTKMKSKSNAVVLALAPWAELCCSDAHEDKASKANVAVAAILV